jgi:hypothetical protein
MSGDDKSITIMRSDRRAFDLPEPGDAPVGREKTDK